MMVSFKTEDKAEGAGTEAVMRQPRQAAGGAADLHHLKWTLGYTETGTYFDVLEPASGASKSPIVMMHGGAHTGTCYLATADLRPGWAQYFAARGHRVFVVDLPGCGRSGYLPVAQLSGAFVCAEIAKIVGQSTEPVILFSHSMSGAYGWKLIEMVGDRIAAIVAVAPSPPGNIQSSAIVVERGADFLEVEQKSTGRLRLSTIQPFSVTQPFVDRKLVGEGTNFPRAHSARYQASLQTMPPLMVIERMNVDGCQLRVDDLERFSNKRVLVLVGTHDPDHSVVLERPLLDWLKAHGAAAEFLSLGDEGIVGNAHMIMMETNSDLVAEKIAHWLG